MENFFRIIVVCLLLGSFAVVEVQAGANVVPVKIVGPAKAFMNETISVIFRVKNEGNENSGPYEVWLYFSKNRTINPAKDLLLDEISYVDTLGVNQPRSRSAQVVVPADLLGKFVGDCYYGMIVNGIGKVFKQDSQHISGFTLPGFLGKLADSPFKVLGNLDG